MLAEATRGWYIATGYSPRAGQLTSDNMRELAEMSTNAEWTDEDDTVTAAAISAARKKCSCSMHRRKCRRTAQENGMCKTCNKECQIVTPPWQTVNSSIEPGRKAAGMLTTGGESATAALRPVQITCKELMDEEFIVEANPVATEFDGDQIHMEQIEAQMQQMQLQQTHQGVEVSVPETGYQKPSSRRRAMIISSDDDEAIELALENTTAVEEARESRRLGIIRR